MRHIFYIFSISLCVISCTGKKINNSFWDESYESLEEAEERLVAYYDSIHADGEGYFQYNEELVDLVLNDTSTLRYPFQQQQEHGHVSVVTSDDGMLRCYTWNNMSGGTCFAYSDIVQYRAADKVYAYNTSIFNLISDGTYEENIFGCDVLKIYTLKTDHQPIYIVYTYNREAANWGYSGVSAVQIVGDEIVDAHIFPNQKSSVGIEHTIAEWYFTANNGEGWDWLFRFDADTQTLYVPVAEPYITDQYTLYRFNGKDMEDMGHSGGFWLHPSIREFKQLFYLFETEEYRVRVDEMDDGTYRYASWLVGQDMSEQPQIVICGGILNDVDGRSCFFENECYTYIVDGDELTVYSPNDQIILRQSKVVYRK